MSSPAIALLLVSVLGAYMAASVVQADSGTPPTISQSELVNQANAPISSIFQIRLQDSYAPAFQGALRGQGNFFSIAVGMPLPQWNRTYIRISHRYRCNKRTRQVAGWPGGCRSVRTAQLAVRSASPKSNLVCGGYDPAARERFVSSAVYYLPARPRMVHQIRAANDFRLGDQQAAVAARPWNWPCLQNWIAVRQQFRRAGLERVGRRTGSEVRNNIWIRLALSEFLGLEPALALEAGGNPSEPIRGRLHRAGVRLWRRDARDDHSHVSA
jgi:hypothetical protein